RRRGQYGGAAVHRLARPALPDRPRRPRSAQNSSRAVRISPGGVGGSAAQAGAGRRSAIPSPVTAGHGWPAISSTLMRKLILPLSIGLFLQAQPPAKFALT